MKVFLTVCFFLTSMFGLGVNSIPVIYNTQQVTARLDLFKLGPVLVIEANVQNYVETIKEVDYVLEIYKLEVSGDSFTIQKGKCRLAPHKCRLVAHSRVSVNVIAKLKVKINVLQENIIIAQDSVVFHGDIH